MNVHFAATALPLPTGKADPWRSVQNEYAEPTPLAVDSSK